MLIALAGQYDSSVVMGLSANHRLVDLDAADGAARTAEILITRGSLTVDQDLLDSLPRLRLIIKAGSGLDNIDLPAAASRNVSVLRTSGSARSVAEMAFALLFAVLRNVPEFDAAVREADWACKSRFLGGLVQGRRLALLGLGEIGRETARMGAGLGMKVAAFDRSPHHPEKAAVIAELGVEHRASIRDLVASADVLSLHVPHQDEDPPLLDRETLALVPAGAIVINTARASLIDQAAFFEALVARRIGGAGLDVHPEERTGRPDPLRALPNVVLTPHVGAQSKEAMAEIGRRIVTLVRRFEIETREADICMS
jgi:D-3-phosphoglycerate dehydrogenase